MKKFALLALAILLMPNIVSAQCDYTPNSTDLYWHSGYLMPDTVQVSPGELYYYGELVICLPGTAGNFDNWCFHIVDDLAWIYGEDAEVCWSTENDGCWGYWYADAQCPTDAVVGTFNTALFIAAYCNTSVVCDPLCNMDTMTVVFEVVKPPVEIEIFQDTLTEVDQGVTAAYIPFQICNGDPAADPRNYTFNITSQGTVGPALDQDGTLTGVPGGDCAWVYGIVDASAALIDDVDTLTIIGRFKKGPVDVRDTCVQAIVVVEAVPVPLFTRPVVTIMVLAMILAAAVVMKKRATSVA